VTLLTVMVSVPTQVPVLVMLVMWRKDVVPVTPGTEKDWKHAPFAGTIVDGEVWGRGTIDDKGSLVALFEAMEALAGQGFKPKRTVILVSGHDEEAGGSGAMAAAKLLASRKVKALFTIDEGGIISTDTPMINGPAALIGIAEKGYMTLRVTANAPGGHSSAPPLPNEIGTVNLAKAVLAINAKQFPMELRGPAEGMVSVLAAKAGGASKVAVANRWLLGGLALAAFALVAWLTGDLVAVGGWRPFETPGARAALIAAFREHVLFPLQAGSTAPLPADRSALRSFGARLGLKVADRAIALLSLGPRIAEWQP